MTGLCLLHANFPHPFSRIISYRLKCVHINSYASVIHQFLTLSFPFYLNFDCVKRQNGIEKSKMMFIMSK